MFLEGCSGSLIACLKKTQMRPFPSPIYAQNHSESLTLFPSMTAGQIPLWKSPNTHIGLGFQWLVMSRPLFVWDLEVQFLLKGFAMLVLKDLAYKLTENYQRVSFLSWTLLPEDTGTGTSFLLMRQLAPQHGLPKTHFIHSVSESRMDNKLSKDRQINIAVRGRKAVKKIRSFLPTFM